MAKHIPLLDKKLVIQRLAEGQSTRESIVGTSIRSNQTAARLAKTESHRIAQIRSAYAKRLEESIYTDINERVRVLSSMIVASKPFIFKGKPRYAISGYLSNKDFHEDKMFWMPDWTTRLKAIQYIDKLTGVTDASGNIQINVLQQQKLENAGK